MLEARPCCLGFSAPGIESFRLKMGWGGGRLPAEFATNWLESRPAGLSTHGYSLDFAPDPGPKSAAFAANSPDFLFSSMGGHDVQGSLQKLKDEGAR